MVSDRRKYEQLLQSLYMDLDDGLINEAEYQEFQRTYRQKLKDIEQTIVNKKKLAQELVNKLQNKKTWLKKLTCQKEESSLNRLTLVTLLDRINISENQEISLVFHDLNEIAILQELSLSEVGVI